MKSDIEWKQWGKVDPLNGVASIAGRERDDENPWTDEEFYRLGADWHDFNAAWPRTTGYQAGAVLEIGSGAVRITRMLSATFAQVIATDVSPDILEYARVYRRATFYGRSPTEMPYLRSMQYSRATVPALPK